MRLLAKLQEIDQARTKLGVAALEDTRRVLGRIAAHPRDEGMPAEKRRARENECHSDGEPRSRGEVQNNVDRKGARHGREEPGQRSKQPDRAAFALENTVGGLDLLEDRARRFAGLGSGRWRSEKGHGFHRSTQAPPATEEPVGAEY